MAYHCLQKWHTTVFNSSHVISYPDSRTNSFYTSGRCLCPCGAYERTWLAHQNKVLKPNQPLLCNRISGKCAAFFHLWSVSMADQVQRLLEMQTTRGADRDGEAIQRILGVPGHAVDGHLNPAITILCLHWWSVVKNYPALLKSQAWRFIPLGRFGPLTATLLLSVTNQARRCTQR